MDDSKGKLKKIRKKAAAGTIFSKEHYELCVAHAIYTGSSVTHKKDPSRGMSKHDINISELRELILSIFLDNVQIPKYFEVKNPQFIRDIVIVHFSNCNGLDSTGRVPSPIAPPVCCVRNFKHTSPLKEHPQHLLTVSMLDDLESTTEVGSCNGATDKPVKSNGSVAVATVAGTTAANIHGMAPYILTEAALRTWGFPVPLSEPLGSVVLESVAKTGCIGKSASKKRKLSDANLELFSTSTSTSEAVGANEKVQVEVEEGYIGGCVHLPSLAAALTVLDTQHQAGKCCTVTPPVAFNDSKASGTNTQKSLVFLQTATNFAVDSSNNGISADSASSLDLSVLALDCEMCDTADGPELTRLSLVDYNGIILLDTLVKPYSPIVDYKEAFSGVNAALLDPVTIRIEQVQVALLRLVSSSTIVVGHSLENDLYALKLSHKCCVDTSVMYPHPMGFPHRHKLKHLAKEFLKINIQNSNSMASGVGHSSVEDARVALQLAKLKVEHGPFFGMLKNGDQECPRQPLVAKFPECVKSAFFFSSGSEELMKRRRGCVGGGVHVSYSVDSTTAVERAVNHLQQVSKRNSLLHDRNFTYIEISCDGYQDNKQGYKNISNDNHGDNEQDLQIENCQYYSYVKKIKECLSTHSNRDVLLLVSTQTSVKEVSDLQNRKRACTKAMSASSWSAELDDMLERRKVVCSYSDVELFTVLASSSTEN